MTGLVPTQGGGVPAPAPQKGWLGRPSTPNPKGSRKNDIVSKRNRLSARLWRLFRSLLPWVLLIGLGMWMYSDPAILSVVLIALSFVARLVFAMFYMIIQFGAIFWFMSRSKVETIKPEDPKTMTFNDYWGLMTGPTWAVAAAFGVIGLDHLRRSALPVRG